MAKSFVTAQDLYRLVQVSDPRFSPDGRWVAFCQTKMDREENRARSAIWLAPAGGGKARRFTNGDGSDTAPRWSPDGRWLAFVSTRGTENSKGQIYLIPVDGGEAHRLTDLPNGASEPSWAPGGTGPARLALVASVNAEEMAAEDAPETDDEVEPEERKRRAEEKKEKEKKKSDPRVISRFVYREGTKYVDDRTKHLYLLSVDLETGQAEGKPRRLTNDGRNYGEPRWLPDGSALLATVNRQPDVDDLFYYPDIVRVPLDGSGARILSEPGTADHNAWPSPDGQWISYNSLPIAEYSAANSEIKRIPAQGGEPVVLTAALDAHPEDSRWMPDGQSLCFLVAERGSADLRSVGVDGGPVETLLSAELEMLAYDLSPDGKQVAFVASSDRAPWDLYIGDLTTKEFRRVTAVNDRWLESEHKALGEVEDLWFESSDGTSIQGWIVKPPDFNPDSSYPLVLSIHGGPHAMWSRHEPTMWHEWQVLAASGYVVLACNPRGSDGYGHGFRASLLNRWGEADLPDLMAGVEAVLAQGYVDPERLVVTGGSYGGFMTAWVIGHDSRFKAAVAQRGVYDMISFYSTSDIPLMMEREFSATPWENMEQLWKYSPLAYVENIHTPLLLIHSENDFRAPIPAAEGLFVALRRLQREVEMVRYPRDGHELSRSGEPKHRVDRLERIVGWFDRHLRPR
jgi:dipeptidyl aminopeptidase/acylaminoacyl peptidase